MRQIGFPHCQTLTSQHRSINESSVIKSMVKAYFSSYLLYIFFLYELQAITLNEMYQAKNIKHLNYSFIVRKCLF